jgi:nitrate reductase NapAB chaperone NapD
MSKLIVAFDIDRQADVMAAIRGIKGVHVEGRPRADGTVTVSTNFRSLDDESAAVHAIEDIHGVIDVRLIQHPA